MLTSAWIKSRNELQMISEWVDNIVPLIAMMRCISLFHWFNKPIPVHWKQPGNYQQFSVLHELFVKRTHARVKISHQSHPEPFDAALLHLFRSSSPP